MLFKKQSTSRFLIGGYSQTLLIENLYITAVLNNCVSTIRNCIKATYVSSNYFQTDKHQFKSLIINQIKTPEII